MDQKTRQWKTKKAEILGQLGEDEIKQLYAHSIRLLKKRGDALWADMDIDTKGHVYILDQGFLRVCELNDDGKRFIVSLLGPGDFFGAILPDTQARETEDYLEVVRDARIIAIDAGIFQRVLGHHPRLVMRMANVIMARQEQFKRRMTSFLFKDVSARLAELLLQYISDYAETLPSDPEDANAPAYPIVSLTHQEIADLIGAARPV
ncbi:MAG: Crp/Fnr family transcriptional regulator, partial [Cyanobacteria bacterium HKST-UBA05]|nr:Crp/Fnr family transcriptional regulator [Cyanobacteria bacterium HKST-UBA05]